MSRFPIQEVPLAAPGCCFLCRASSRDLFFDTQIQVEFFGAAIICNECVTEMAANLGWYSEQDKKNLETKLFDALGELRETKRKLEGALEVIHGYRRMDTDISDSDYNSKPDIDNELSSNEDNSDLLSERTRSFSEKMATGFGEADPPLHRREEGINESSSNEDLGGILPSSEFKLQF